MKYLLVFLLLLGSSAHAKDPWRQGPQPGQILKAEQAFALLPVEVREGQLMLRWQIAPGYYLYQQRISATPELKGAKPYALQFPPGQARQDEHFGAVITHGGAQASTLNLAVPVKSVPARLRVQYQGCAEVGVCLPPQTRVVEVQKP